MYMTNNYVNERDYFKDYVFHELYDSSKDYSVGFHMNGVNYIYDFCTVDNKKYAVAIERISDKELKQLRENCQCFHCLLPWYDMSKYFANGSSFGCLKYTHNNIQNVKIIQKTRDYIRNIVDLKESTPLFI